MSVNTVGSSESAPELSEITHGVMVVLAASVGSFAAGGLVGLALGIADSVRGGVSFGSIASVVVHGGTGYGNVSVAYDISGAAAVIVFGLGLCAVTVRAAAKGTASAFATFALVFAVIGAFFAVVVGEVRASARDIGTWLIDTARLDSRVGADAGDGWDPVTTGLCLVARVAAWLMPSAERGRWQAEVASYLAECEPEQQQAAAWSYVRGVPPLLLVMWTGELARRVRGAWGQQAAEGPPEERR